MLSRPPEVSWALLVWRPYAVPQLCAREKLLSRLPVSDVDEQGLDGADAEEEGRAGRCGGVALI